MNDWPKVRLGEILTERRETPDSNEFLSIPDATNAMELAISRHKVDFILGGFRTEAVQVMQDMAMDNKKILLVNLSKGKTGELNSQLLGMIFVMKFQVAAMGRGGVLLQQTL